MEIVYKLFLKSVMISGFVFIMMIMIEYINVQTKGVWQKHLSGNKWKQYLLAGLLGGITGLFGGFYNSYLVLAPTYFVRRPSYDYDRYQWR